MKLRLYLLITLLLGPATATADTPLTLFDHQLKKIRLSLHGVVLQVAATQRVSGDVTPLPVAYGYAVLVKRPGKNTRNVLVTAQRLVLKASVIKITTASGKTFTARVGRLDPQKALAQLIVDDPKFLRHAKVVELASGKKLRARTMLYSLVYLPNKQEHLVWGALVSTQPGPLHGYWGTELGIVNGLPMFHFNGKLLALNFRYGFGSTKMGFAAGVTRINNFLQSIR